MVNNLKGYIVNIFDFDQLQLSRQEWFVDPSMFNIKKRVGSLPSLIWIELSYDTLNLRYCSILIGRTALRC